MSRQHSRERELLIRLRELVRGKQDGHARRSADALRKKIVKQVASCEDPVLIRSTVCAGDDWIVYVNEPMMKGFITRNNEAFEVAARAEVYWQGVLQICEWFEKYLRKEKSWRAKGKKRHA